MHKMEELREKLVRELEELSSKGELSMGSLDAIDKLTHSIKSIDTILAMKGYSNDGYSYKRDSMGRYSRDEGYSRNDGYSRKEISDTLRGLSRTADGESKRMIESWMKELDRN